LSIQRNYLITFFLNKFNFVHHHRKYSSRSTNHNYLWV